MLVVEVLVLTMWDRVFDPVVRPMGAEGTMQPKYEYRRRLPHYQKDDHPLFIPFTTDRRWKLPPQPEILSWNVVSMKTGISSNIPWLRIVA